MKILGAYDNGCQNYTESFNFWEAWQVIFKTKRSRWRAVTIVWIYISLMITFALFQDTILYPVSHSGSNVWPKNVLNESSKSIIIWAFSISVASVSTSVPSCHPYMDCCSYHWPKLLNTPTPLHIHSSVYIKFHCSRETQNITNKEGSMRSGYLSIILSLAVTAYCEPLSQVTVQDERFAEVRSIFFTLDCISSQHFELYDP